MADCKIVHEFHWCQTTPGVGFNPASYENNAKLIATLLPKE